MDTPGAEWQSPGFSSHSSWSQLSHSLVLQKPSTSLISGFLWLVWCSLLRYSTQSNTLHTHPALPRCCTMDTRALTHGLTPVAALRPQINVQTTDSPQPVRKRFYKMACFLLLKPFPFPILVSPSNIMQQTLRNSRILFPAFHDKPHPPRLFSHVSSRSKFQQIFTSNFSIIGQI